MPKHAVNTSEQAKIRKFFNAGNSAEAIAAHMNVDLGVVKAWHPDNVEKVRAELRAAEHSALEEEKEEKAARAVDKANDRLTKASALVNDAKTNCKSAGIDVEPTF